jgi:hypothetical protein
MRTVKWLSCLGAAALAGCSTYPIPDDVTATPTEDIVRHARCEIRTEIIGFLIEQGVVAPSATDKEIAAVVAKLKKSPKSFFGLLMNVGSAYTFNFNITEHNNAHGMANFSLPFTVPKVLTAGGDASLDLLRVGSRAFETGDRWDDLIVNTTRCAGVQPQPGNFVYPLGGSIGVGRAVRTFIEIVWQGGELGSAAKDSFVDTLTFTTTVSADANASITLAPVSHSFRLVSASASVLGSRTDIHTLTLSLAFPHPQDPPAPKAITGVTLGPGYLNAPFQRPPEWRARYNLCVQDGRQREDAAHALRFEAPEVYCITLADAFYPKPGQQPDVQQTLLPLSAPPPGRPEEARRTAPIVRAPVRPNRQ